MTRRRWSCAGCLGMVLLISSLAGCAKQPPPMDAGAGQGDPSADTRGLTTTDTQPPNTITGRLDESDRAVTEGRMSGMDPAAAREAFLNIDVLFSYNSFALTDEARQLLEEKAQWMAQNPEVSVQLEGHCDERGTMAYNLALGERRANAVRQYMSALGVRADRITTVSYGEEFPIDPGHGEAAWARNRRAHFAILDQ